MTVAKDATAVRNEPRSLGSGAARWVKNVWPSEGAKSGCVPKFVVNFV